VYIGKDGRMTVPKGVRNALGIVVEGEAELLRRIRRKGVKLILL